MLKKGWIVACVKYLSC